MMLSDVIIFSMWVSRRGVHASTYDKNHEDHHHPTVVPDDVIPSQAEIYWAPHPQTGVFGPVAGHTSSEDSSVDAGAESVLEQKAFFRPQEDLDKPAVHP